MKKQIKKIGLVLIVMALMLVAVFAISACDDIPVQPPPPNETTHLLTLSPMPMPEGFTYLSVHNGVEGEMRQHFWQGSRVPEGTVLTIYFRGDEDFEVSVRINGIFQSPTIDAERDNLHVVLAAMNSAISISLESQPLRSNQPSAPTRLNITAPLQMTYGESAIIVATPYPVASANNIHFLITDPNGNNFAITQTGLPAINFIPSRIGGYWEIYAFLEGFSNVSGQHTVYITIPYIPTDGYHSVTIIRPSFGYDFFHVFEIENRNLSTVRYLSDNDRVRDGLEIFIEFSRVPQYYLRLYINGVSDGLLTSLGFFSIDIILEDDIVIELKAVSVGSPSLFHTVTIIRPDSETYDWIAVFDGTTWQLLESGDQVRTNTWIDINFSTAFGFDIFMYVNGARSIEWVFQITRDTTIEFVTEERFKTVGVGHLGEGVLSITLTVGEGESQTVLNAGGVAFVREGTIVRIDWQTKPNFVGRLYLNGSMTTNSSFTVWQNMEFSVVAYPAHIISIIRPTSGYMNFYIAEIIGEWNYRTLQDNDVVAYGAYIFLEFRRSIGYDLTLYVNGILTETRNWHQYRYAVLEITQNTMIEIKASHRYYLVEALPLIDGISNVVILTEFATGVSGNILPLGLSRQVREGSFINVSWEERPNFVGRLYVSGIRTSGENPSLIHVLGNLELIVVPTRLHTIGIVRPTFGYTSFFVRDERSWNIIQHGEQVLDGTRIDIEFIRAVGYDLEVFVNGVRKEMNTWQQVRYVVVEIEQNTTIELRVGRRYYSVDILPLVSGVEHFVARVDGEVLTVGETTQIQEGRFVEIELSAYSGLTAMLYINGVRLRILSEIYSVQVLLNIEISIVVVDYEYVNVIVAANIPLRLTIQIRDHENILLQTGYNLVRLETELNISWNIFDPWFAVYIIVGGVRSNRFYNNITENTILVDRDNLTIVFEIYDLWGTPVRVCFDSNGGRMAPNFHILTLAGNWINQPSGINAPTKIGHRLTGWHTSRHEVGEQTDESRWDFWNSVWRSKTLYAGWEFIGNHDEYLNDETRSTWVQGGHVYFHYSHGDWHNDTRYVRNANGQLIRNANGIPRRFHDYAFWVWGEPHGEGVRVDFQHFCEISGAIGMLNFNQIHMAGVNNNIPIDFRTFNQVSFLVGTRNTVGFPGIVWGRDGANVYLENVWICQNEGGHFRKERNVVHVFMERGRTIDSRTTWIADESITNFWDFHPGVHSILTRGWAETRSTNIDESLYVMNNGERIYVDFARPVVNDISSPAPIMPNSPDFLQNVGVGYQIFVPTFASSACAIQPGFGTLRGIINVLESGYFCELGVGALWLTPINLSASYSMYDAICFFSIDPRV